MIEMKATHTLSNQIPHGNAETKTSMAKHVLLHILQSSSVLENVWVEWSTMSD